MAMEQIAEQLLRGPPGDAGQGLCILSLDGGGVRGLSALYLLRALMARVNDGRKNLGLQPVKPFDIFDLIGGTSTGGIIAIMLGRLEMDVAECIAVYRELIGKIFKSKVSRTGLSLTGSIKARFSSAVLEEAIITVIEDRPGFSRDDLLDDAKKRKCRVLVCAVAKETKGVVRLKSYTNDGEASPSVPPKIWQAALATSAATGFFNPVKIGARTYVDGALHVNNPVEEVEQEACDIWFPDTAELKGEVACFVSIGTGNPGKDPIHDNAFKFLSKTLVKISTETQVTAERFANSWRSLLNKRYFRLNIQQGLQNVALEAYGDEGTIEAATDEYLREFEQVTKLKTIAETLKWKDNLVASQDEVITIWSEQTLDDPERFERLARKPGWKSLVQGQNIRDIFDRISSYEPDRTCREIARRRCPGTALGILQESTFIAWLEGFRSPCLLLSGPIGSGKTLVTSTIIERLPLLRPRSFVGHFFYQHSHQNRLTAEDAFRSFVKQMIVYLDAMGQASEMAVIRNVKRYFGTNKPPPTFYEVIDDLFLPLCKQVGASTFVIDGLDVCDQGEVVKVLKVWKKVMSLNDDSRWLITSRESVASDAKRLYEGAAAVKISDISIESDIRTLIDWKINELDAERVLTHDEDLLADIRTQLNANAHKMILWVSLQLDTLWAQCTTDSEIRRALTELPQDLDETYERCLSWIIRTQRYARLAPRILHWIL